MAFSKEIYVFFTLQNARFLRSETIKSFLIVLLSFVNLLEIRIKNILQQKVKKPVICPHIKIDLIKKI